MLLRKDGLTVVKHWSGGNRSINLDLPDERPASPAMDVQNCDEFEGSAN
jgi:hypothetical protein